MHREVKLYIRLFPVPERDWESFKTDNKMVYIKCNNAKQGEEPRVKFWQYTTDGIFTNHPQEIIYRDLTKGVFEKVFDGIDLLYMAYGQSGTGKTYTITGINGKYQFRGLVPRFITELFYYRQYLGFHKKMKFTMSHCEVVGKSVYDLITRQPTLVPFHKEPTRVEIDSEALALRLIFEGERKRRHEKENTHCGSSVLVLHVATESLVHSDPLITSSRVYFVDMAGVETVWRRETKSFACQREANLQKSAIEHMATWAKALSSDDYLKANQRNSRLLHILGEPLKNGFVRLIGHVIPMRDHLSLTTSILKFGLRLKKFPSPTLVYASHPNPTLVQENLKKELAELKDQILTAELLKGAYNPVNMTQEHLEHVKRLGRAYFDGSISEPITLSAVETNILLPVLRGLYQDQVRENEEITSNAIAAMHHDWSMDMDTRDSLKSRKSKYSRASRISTMNLESRNEQQTKGKGHSKKPGTNTGSLKSSANVGSIVKEQDPGIVESPIMKTLEVPTRDVLWKEFLNRYPHMKTRLDTLQEEHDNAVKEKEKLTYVILEVKALYDWNKARLENAMWERKVNLGEKCDQYGQLIISDEEKELQKAVEGLEEAYRNEKSSVQSAQDRYMEALSNLIDYRQKVEQEFQDYSIKTYAACVVIPPLIAESEVQIPHPTCNEQKNQPAVHESETFFTHLQQTHWKKKCGHGKKGGK